MDGVCIGRRRRQLCMPKTPQNALQQRKNMYSEVGGTEEQYEKEKTRHRNSLPCRESITMPRQYPP